MLTSLNRADPANTDWAAALIDARHGLAEVQLDRFDAGGDLADPAYLAAARAESDSAMDLADRREAVQPDRLQWQLFMLKLETQRADIELVAGKTPAARQYAVAAAKRASRLQSVADAPDWRRRFALAYQRLAELELAVGDLAAARLASDRALPITRKLRNAAASDNPQFDLITMLGTRGEIEWRAGAWPAGGAFIREALQVANTLRKNGHETNKALELDIAQLRVCARDIALHKAPGSLKC